jgi:ABC-type multidrug transport system fused ATPase/permease subunit
VLNDLRTLVNMLEPRERRRAWFVATLTVMMALLETLGVASIMPFVGVLAKPEIVETNKYVAAAYSMLGFESLRGFLIFLGTATLLLLVGSTALRALTLWAQLGFTNYQNHSLAQRLVSGYLGQPYEWFLNEHSSGMSTKVLSEVTYIVQGAFFTALVLLANVCVSLFLVLLLFAVDPLLAVGMAGLIGGTYVSVYRIARRYLARAGAERRAANEARFRVLNEAFGGIKEIKIGNLERRFADRFRVPSLLLSRHSIVTMMISELPSYIMQALILGGMVLVLVYLIGARGGVQEALPFVALYSLAGYRLMPALQGIYRGFTQLRIMMPGAQALDRDLREVSLAARTVEASAPDPAPVRGQFTQELVMREISYRYPRAESMALDGVSMQIPAYSTIGLVGPTGSGKTSLIDLILGLLRPTAGEMLADGVPIETGNLTSWQRLIGYVPQAIFLSDDTVAGNIAFGVPTDRIDMAAVVRAARIARLHELVESLPAGYHTSVGERGVRLSGGQRQRIGIARALYHDPDILIFDEATSALDTVTESAVMDSIQELARKKTILLIAHRLNSVRSCDRIYLLERGRITATGSFDELLKSSEIFRDMAGRTR